jgi:antitoxin (DNA-binding transcriptional repressor) of toxin-antitoxin stability system
MRSAQVSELKERLEEVIEAVKNGETVEILDGDASLAELVPTIGARHRQPNPDQTALKAHLDKLVRQGKARRGTGKLPDDFLTRELPKADASVLEQLLEDRRTGR